MTLWSLGTGFRQIQLHAKTMKRSIRYDYVRYRVGSYLTENTVHVHYKEQSFRVVYGNNRCVLGKLEGMIRCTECLMLKLLVRIVTTGLSKS